MAGIYFDGQNIIRPQIRSRVDALGMTPIVLGSAGVLMIFGTSEGGTPNNVYTLSSPQLAAQIFRSGNLLTAAQRAWNASNAVAGATVIKMVRVGLGTVLQSTLNLLATATPVITITSLDYGVYTIGIQVKVEAGTLSGKKVSVKLGTYIEVYDNLADNDAIVAALNNNSALVSAVKLQVTAPDNLVYTALAGGSDGTITSSHWQTAFNMLLTSSANFYNLTTDDAAIQALLVTVVTQASNQGHEGIIVLGGAASESVAQVKARALAFGSSRVKIAYPGLKQYNSAGAIVTESPVFTAAEVAGVNCGSAIEEPGTYKFINAVGIEKVLTMDELDDLDANGVIGVEFVQNRGYRIVHDQTTWLADTNVLFREGSVRRIADYILGSVRDDLVAYVGRPGSITTISSIKIKVSSKLDLIKLAGLITDGVDNAGVAQPAYRNIQISFNSLTGICSVEFEVSPVTPINYVLITGHFRATNIVVA